MTLPLSVAIKSFFGIYVLTPFEQELLGRLGDTLEPMDKEILAFQCARFTTVRRLIRHVDEPNAHGYTRFYTLRFSKDVSAKIQTRRFASIDAQAILATAHVVFEGGQIEVKIWLVRGVMSTFEYRSPQKIYYPSGDYRIETMNAWPRGDTKID